MINQTAIDYLVMMIWGGEGEPPLHIKPIIEKALEMEREQIMKAFDEGQEYEYQYHINLSPRCDSQTYFDETYGGDK
jgi:hypothetical protein